MGFISDKCCGKRKFEKVVYTERRCLICGDVEHNVHRSRKSQQINEGEFLTMTTKAINQEQSNAPLLEENTGLKADKEEMTR